MRRWSTKSGYLMFGGLRFAATDIPRDVREAITKSLNAVKEESKGQCLDLTDMNEASRNAANALQEMMKRHNVEDAKFKGKMATLSASLKAYNTRLNNLQNESRSVQREVEGALKLLWGGEEAPSQESSAPEPTPSSNDFDVDVPPIAQKLEEINNSPPRATFVEAEPVVETVEGEIVSDSSKPTTTSSSSSPSDGSIEDLEIEIESPEEKRLSDTKPIHEITQELHEKDIDFTDCLDASSLRRRYQDVLDGKIKSKADLAREKRQAPKAQTQTQQPPNPRPPQQQSSYSSPSGGYQPPPPNTSETGLAADPFPNGERKMIDPMQLVSQVKLDIAREKNMDVNTFDIWSGHVRLEDHKRLYDYPTIQQFPLEVRQKGDPPSGYSYGR